jgi:hypothetical protein
MSVKLRLLTSLAGPSGAWGPGDVIEVDSKTAERMLAAGLAEPVDGPPAGVPTTPEAQREAKVQRRGKKA